MPKQLRVFVSHSHADTYYSRIFAKALSDAGADVWYDEHNLGSGQFVSVISKELSTRPIFVLILSKAAFASKWVEREAMWAYQLQDRDPSRVILPVTVEQIARDDFNPETGWLFLHEFKRIEAPGFTPYPPEEAARHLVRSLGLTPTDEATVPISPQPTEDVNDLLTRGKALLAQKQYAETLSFFERATQLAPASFEAWANLGLVYNATGQYVKALHACERALALDFSNAEVWNNKGEALKGLQRYSEALAAYNQALALDPNGADAWNNKGAALYNLKRSAEALAAFDRTLALDPNYRNAWNNKGVVLRALGRTAEAEAAEKRAKELGWKG